MAVTGEFLADFLDFVRGAKQAEDSLDKLEGKGTSMAGSWDKAFKDLNIEKFFQNPLAAATDLVKDFGAALGPAGIAAVGAAAGVTALVSAVISMGNASADTAEAIGHLSDKTGLTVEELSKLNNAAVLAGTSGSALADVVFTMQTRMEKNPQDFANGLKALSINAKEFKDASPYEQLDLFTRGLAANSSVLERNNAGLDIAGKSYKEMAPALIELGRGAIESGEKLGHVFTEEEVRQANAYHTAVNEIHLTMQGMADDIGSAVVPALGWIAQHFDDFMKGPVKKEWEETKDNLRAVAAFLEQIGVKTEDAGIKAIDVKDKFKEAYGVDRVNDLAKLRDAIDVTTNAKVRDKEITKELADAERNHQEALDKYADELIKDQAAHKEIIEIGEGWRKTLEGLDPVMVAGIQHLLDMGVSQQALAREFGYSVEQIGAMNKGLIDHNKNLDAAMAHERDLVLTLQGLQQAYEKLRIDASDDSAAHKQIANIQAVANAAELALAQRGIVDADISAQIRTNAQLETDAVLAGVRAQDKGTQDYYARLAAEAKGAYADALASGGKYSEGRIAQLKAESDAAADNLRNWRQVADEAISGVGSTATATAGAVRTITDALGTMDKQLQGTFAQPSSLHQEMRFGQPVLVNANGDVVQANLQPQFGAGGFLGYGLPQGQTMQNVVNISGILMGNDPAARQQLADAVGGALTSTLKGQGVRLGNA